MNTIAGAVVLCLVLLAPLVGYGGFLIFRGLGLRLGRGGRFGGMAAAALAALAGLAAAGVLDGGQPTRAVVISRSETIKLARLELLPAVIHVLRVSVRPVGAGSGPVTLALDPGHFDRLREGQIVLLKVSAIGPLRFAHLADAPGWMQLPVLEFSGLAAVAAAASSIAAIGMGLLTPWLPRRWRGLALGAVLLAVALDASVFAPSWTARPLRGKATVVSVRTVSEARLQSWSSRRSTESFALPTPYDEATLRFTPAPTAEPVTIVDRIDTGTGGDLTGAETVEVAYAQSDPRGARLTIGTRTYAEKAYAARLGGMAVQTSLGLMVLSIGAFFMVRLASRRRPRPVAGVRGPRRHRRTSHRREAKNLPRNRSVERTPE